LVAGIFADVHVTVVEVVRGSLACYHSLVIEKVP